MVHFRYIIRLQANGNNQIVFAERISLDVCEEEDMSISSGKHEF